MANFCDDMPPSLIKVTGNFKTITGGGRLSGEDKGVDSFEFTPYAKFWINCNKLPHQSANMKMKTHTIAAY